MMKNLLTALLAIACIFTGIAYLQTQKSNRQLAEQLQQLEEKAKTTETETATLRDTLQTLKAAIPPLTPQQQPSGSTLPGPATSPTPAEPAGSSPVTPESESTEPQPEATQALQEEIGKHSALIGSRVKRAWLIPPGSPSNLVCILKIELLPSGEVQNVRVTQSSGNTAFDRSTVAAVKKAAPFPMPEDPDVAARFKSFNFKFRPEG
jgi:colicin import membrane protein